MITHNNGVFALNTPNTTYAFRVMPTGHLQHLYYGSKLPTLTDVDFLVEKQGSGQGTAIAIDNDKNKFFPDNTLLEISSVHRGDYRESLVIVQDEQHNVTAEYIYQSHCFVENFVVPNLPNSHGKSQTLAVTLADKAKQIEVTLFYSLFDNCDVIAKSVAITNKSDKEVRLLRAFSNQLDLPTANFVLDTLDGAWARERYVNSNPLACGITKLDSKRGVSSNTHNPFVMLKEPTCTLDNGIAYGFNLVYSGNHAEILDKTPLGKVRVLNGVNDFAFCWHLAPQQTFHTPEATLCFSDCGTNGLSCRYHHFVNNHIVPKQWANKPRPILINNWEATYFNFTEKKLLDIAKKAQKLGIELFVLDDGWFGKRTDDTKGLGDWVENKHRLPGGLKGLAKKIKDVGLDFGVWVEPEMVNPDSDLYRAHPDWALTHPLYTPLQCRNQLMLDLANEQVCNYLIESICNVIQSADISYVKWDFNRPMTEYYSPTLGNRQGEQAHRHTMGQCRIMQEITSRFPNVLFESCASGGNRVDLGVLCYMPQFWCSDNTDSFDRVKIHEGTLCGYPQSCIGSHVSASPNHQTLRQSTVDNRFNTACIGAFGYELDLAELNKIDSDAIKKQIEWYKKYRNTLQFGQYYKTSSIFNSDKASWVIVAKDGSQAVANLTLGVAQTIPDSTMLKVPHLASNKTYKIETRQQLMNLKAFGSLINHVAPIHLKECSKLLELAANNFPLKTEVQSYVVSGETLGKCGIALNQAWSSTGYDGNTRVMFDFGSRLFGIDEITTDE